MRIGGINIHLELTYHPYCEVVEVFSAAQVLQLGLGGVQSQLTRMAGRPVNFMIYNDAAAAAAAGRSASMLVP